MSHDDTHRPSLRVDTDLVRLLAEMLGETGLTEIEVEDGDRRIRVARGGAAAPQAYVAAPAPLPAPVAAPAPAAEASAAPAPAPATSANAVRSPMVGTAYLSPEPGAAPFKAVGDAVAAGDTIMIVEAMKVMNPITATSGGKLVQLLVTDGQPVEYDQPLFVVE